MHPVGQILIDDEKREFQNRGTEHIHPPVRVIDAPRLAENDKTKIDEVGSFIDKCISCSVPNKNVKSRSHLSKKLPYLFY